MIDSQSTEGLKPEKLNSDIVFENIHFNYPARPKVQVRAVAAAYIHSAIVLIQTIYLVLAERL